MERRKFLETGKIINTHGVKGEMKIMSLCNSPCDFLKIEHFFRDSEGRKSLIIQSKRLHGEFPLIKAEGIDTVEAAALCKNGFIYSPREEIPLPEGEHFIADLIGLPVIHAESGKPLGKIADVLQNTPQTVYEIESITGEAVYIPAVKQFIIKTDIDSGMYVMPIDGMFSGEAYEV